MNDIFKLIDQTVMADLSSSFISTIQNGTNNKYLEVDGKLYVLKNKQKCEEFLNYDKDSIKYEDLNDNSIRILWSTNEFNGVIIDNKIYSTGLSFYCNDPVNQLENRFIKTNV